MAADKAELIVRLTQVLNLVNEVSDLSNFVTESLKLLRYSIESGDQGIQLPTNNNGNMRETDCTCRDRKGICHVNMVNGEVSGVMMTSVYNWENMRGRLF